MYALLDGILIREIVGEVQRAQETWRLDLAIVVLCQRAPLNLTFWRSLPLTLHSRIYVILERSGEQ